MGDARDLLPPPSDDAEVDRSALGTGRLPLRWCTSCRLHRPSALPVCPMCGSRNSVRVDASGVGTLFSWVRYHRSYLPAFASLVPYPVGLVELDEGAHVIGRLVGVDDPVIGTRLRAGFERWADGEVVPVFGPATGEW
ncbi:MAG: hypothetical protein ABS80_02210 [Pseudonocardia sp. SCN 72-51]|nr:MAG: hypothetical protein ABS80_02210 [Pseudonocardia sp. SCN 72-51]